jgi:hypothetical protein
MVQRGRAVVLAGRRPQPFLPFPMYDVGFKQPRVIRTPPDLMATIRQYLVIFRSKVGCPRRVPLNQPDQPRRALTGKHDADGKFASCARPSFAGMRSTLSGARHTSMLCIHHHTKSRVSYDLPSRQAKVKSCSAGTRSVPLILLP